MATVAARVLRLPTVLWSLGVFLPWLTECFGQALTPSPVTFSPWVANSYFGTSIAVGDFNGDGIPDLLVGAPGTLGDGLLFVNPYPAIGRAYIYYGPDFTASAPLQNPLPLANTAFGWKVTAGRCPLSSLRDTPYVSAPLERDPSANPGTVYAYTDDPPTTPVSFANPALPFSNVRFGTSLALRYQSGDLIVGSTGFSTPTQTTGRVYSVACNLQGSYLGYSNPPLYCTEPNYGASVAIHAGSSGPRVVIGTPYEAWNYANAIGGFGCGTPSMGQGRVHVSAVPGDYLFWYQSPENSFASSIMTGKLSADANMDTAVGTPYSNTVHLFRLNSSTTNPFGGPGTPPPPVLPGQAYLYGEPSQILNYNVGYFGRSLAIADATGARDAMLVVGAPGGIPMGGHVYAFSGSLPFSNPTVLSWPGLAPGVGFCPEDYLGWSVAVGDFNGDGRVDIAAGRPCDGLEEEGSVTVFYGCGNDDECASGTCSQGFCMPGTAP